MVPGLKLQKSLPEILTAEERANYQTMWGFDPVADQRPPPPITPSWIYRDSTSMYFIKNTFMYEAPVPLDHDPELQSLSVTLLIRTVADDIGQSHNHMIFTREKQSVEPCCWHSPVIPTTYPDVPGSEYIAATPPENLPRLINSTESHSAYLTPWENFIALKSFACGIAEIGFLYLWDEGEREDGGEGNGLFPLLKSCLPQAIRTIAPEFAGPFDARRYKQTFADAPALLASPDVRDREKAIFSLGLGGAAELELVLAGDRYLTVGVRAQSRIIDIFLSFLEENELNKRHHHALEGLFVDAISSSNPTPVSRSTIVGTFRMSDEDWEDNDMDESGEDDPEWEERGRMIDQAFLHVDQYNPQVVLQAMQAIFTFLHPSSKIKRGRRPQAKPEVPASRKKAVKK